MDGLSGEAGYLFVLLLVIVAGVGYVLRAMTRAAVDYVREKIGPKK